VSAGRLVSLLIASIAVRRIAIRRVAVRRALERSEVGDALGERPGTVVDADDVHKTVMFYST